MLHNELCFLPTPKNCVLREAVCEKCAKYPKEWLYKDASVVNSLLALAIRVTSLLSKSCRIDQPVGTQ